MLAAVFATFEYKNVAQDPPGVYTRWWDGTTQRVDVFYPNGKLKSTTTYGDDGKTVMIDVQLTDQGAIIHSKVRQEDGKVLEKNFSEDGKVLLAKILWSGDETYFVARQEFYEDGTLQSESIMTEDGQAPVSRRMFNPDGSLAMESKILANADQEAKQYLNGKVIHRSVFKANADKIDEFYRPATGIISRRTTETALTKDVYNEVFDDEGNLVYSSLLPAAGGNVVNTVYFKGKIVLRQTASNFLLTTVEEFSPGAANPRRKIELDGAGNPVKVYIYRPDGTLARVKTLQDGAVKSQADYDASGTRVIHSQPGGEPETISPDLLRPALPRLGEDPPSREQEQP
jgi:antitoxin component YwqK of YwqJK toxin-antitoxin module